VIDDSLGDEVRITVIAAGFDRFEGEKRPSRGLTSLGLDDDIGDGIDFGSTGDDGDGDDQFDVPEFLR
jgi:cell division protein FtsZ